MNYHTAILALGLMLATPLTVGGEVIGHISDDTASVTPAAETPKNNDRRIIYRVICAPGGEVLPDCERPLNDNETVAQPVLRQEEPLPANDAGTEDEPAHKPLKAKAKSASGKKRSTKKAKKIFNKKKGAQKAVARKKARKKR